MLGCAQTGTGKTAAFTLPVLQHIETRSVPRRGRRPIRALVLTRRHAPPVTGALAKAASGALESVALVRVNNLARSLDALAELGYWRLGLDVAATTPLSGYAPGPAVALVLGAEDTGLRRLTAGRCDELVQLPIAPLVQSLNVSHAAAIALYELARKPLGD